MSPFQVSFLVSIILTTLLNCQADSDIQKTSRSHHDFPVLFNSIGGDVTEISTRGNEVWAIKKDKSIYRYIGGGWRRVAGQAVNIAATADGWAWMVDQDDQVFRYDPHAEEWEQMPGSLMQVSAVSRHEAIGVNREKTVFLWSGYQWTVIPHGPDSLPSGAVWASIGQDDERWAVGAGLGIWRWSHEQNKWVLQPGVARMIDVHSPKRIISVTDNLIYQWSPEKKDWHWIPEKQGRKASIGDHAIFTVDNAGVVSAHGL